MTAKPRAGGSQTESWWQQFTGTGIVGEMNGSMLAILPARLCLYRGEMPKGIAPLAYVVKVGKQAWPLEKLKNAGTIVTGDLTLSWTKGQNSALDQQEISEGRDIGNVVVRRKTFQGMKDEVHDLTIAFVFHAFVDGGTIHK